MEDRAGRRTVGQFPPLLALLVGVEDESALIESLEQHHPHMGHAVAIDGRERHGVGIGGFGPARLVEPGAEQAQRLVGVGEVTAR